MLCCNMQWRSSSRHAGRSADAEAEQQPAPAKKQKAAGPLDWGDGAEEGGALTSLEQQLLETEFACAWYDLDEASLFPHGPKSVRCAVGRRNIHG
jgi:hypothetical protein